MPAAWLIVPLIDLPWAAGARGGVSRLERIHIAKTASGCIAVLGGAGRARAPLHRIHHLRGGGQRRRSAAAWRPRRSLHIFRALCRPGEGPAPSGAQRRLPPGGTLIGPLAALPNCKAPPYPRERRPGRVAHRRSGSRRARHARGQRDAGVPHAGGKPWAGPSGIRLAIPIGVPRGGGWLLNDRQSHKC